MSEASGAQFSGQGLADPVSLEKIDQLFACNLGEYIDLPQLVVVGDQSSGKSSVLEGLTKLPFPRDSWLCTRFATHIIFRRTGAGTIRNITASIIPAQGSILEHAKKMNAWKATSLQSLDRASFSQTMVEVRFPM